MKWCNARNVIITYRKAQIMLIYTEEKKFTKEQAQQLFLSVNWIFGHGEWSSYSNLQLW